VVIKKRVAISMFLKKGGRGKKEKRYLNKVCN
jgi:hypothetical protein